MRATIAIAVLSAACRFDPSGGSPAGDGAITADAALVDGGPTDGRPPTPVDAASIDATACPAGYPVVRGGHRYGLRAQLTEFLDAKQACEQELPGRTHLATFELADLDTVLTMVDPGNGATPWVGARCLPPADCNQTLSWFWLGGTPIVPVLWNETQPDNGDNEHAACTARLRGQWRLSNVLDGLSLPYICECDP